MKKQCTLFALIICFCFPANGQVFISKIQAETFLFGPESVSADGMPIANHWITLIQEFQEELHFIAAQNSLLIDELEAQTRRKSRDQRKLVRLQEENGRIEEELSLAEEILFEWQGVSAAKQRGAGRCLELMDPTEIDAAQAVALGSEETVVTEFIPTEYVAPKKEWVKKVADKNCLSADPNDCLVWCLVEVQEGIRFVDYEGLTQQSTTCPVSFNYEESSKSCIRKWRVLSCPDTN